MIKRKHKFISLILCVMLVLSALFACSVSASAANGDKIYVKINKNWSTVYCYMWTDGAGDNGSWPGKVMTCVDSANKIYSYTLNGDYAKVIFNNGESGGGDERQTGDLVYQGNGMMYDMATGGWGSYSGASTDPTASTTPSVPSTTAPVTPGTGKTVYLKNTAGWSNPYCYTWTAGESDRNAAWPGKAMTNIGNNVWSYTGSDDFESCIFSDNKSPQTTDLIAQDGYIFDNSTNKWEIYDTNTVKVTNFSAEPASNIYTGMDVTLSASATSTDGAVSYKFSVTSPSGTTSALTGFISTGKATWTPTAAGTYTITFDFKDAAGNTNSRTLSLTVESDTSLVKPVIKKVTPVDASYVKTGTSQTVTVTAGGGKTGTNLLFYKYIVTDPSGTKNTPYYTLNNTYSFTATKIGTYKVEVYVQASDNSTVSKTYTYISTTDTIVTDPTTEPTTPDVPTYKKGDVNKDGRVDIQDATYIQKCVAEYSDYQDVTLELGDIYEDGRITIRDVTELQRRLVQEDAS